MSLRGVYLTLAAAGLLPVGVAMAQINGLTANPYVFDGHPTSNLTLVHSNSVNPGSANINDEFDSVGADANRHDVLLSSDGGLTPHTFSISDKFTVKAEVTLNADSDSPRKEAGLRINSPVTGDALFIVNSDAGEIVAFGGPFFNAFDPPGGYTTGDTILMGFTYLGNTGMGPATIEYFIDRGAGIESSGPLAFTNLEEGAVDFNVAMYGQGAPATVGDFVNADFANIMYIFIPEPTTGLLSAIAVAGFALFARRRTR